MTHKIREVYIVHHSHTDVGYTDLQEQVIYNQANNIRRAVELIENGIKNNTTQKDLKWNCETWYCVEQFFKMATEEEKEKFFDLVKKGNIGLSANYLNFNDLADCKYLKEKIHTMQEICGEKGIQIKTAMIAWYLHGTARCPDRKRSRIFVYQYPYPSRHVSAVSEPETVFLGK